MLVNETAIAVDVTNQVRGPNVCAVGSARLQYLNGPEGIAFAILTQIQLIAFSVSHLVPFQFENVLDTRPAVLCRSRAHGMIRQRLIVTA